MNDAMIGWDFFRAGDYSDVDAMVNSGQAVNIQVARSKIKIGHVFIFAMNMGPIRFLKRSFIKI